METLTFKMKEDLKEFNEALEEKYQLTILVDFAEYSNDKPYLAIWYDYRSDEDKHATYKIPNKILKSDTQTQKAWIEKTVTSKFLSSQFKRYKYFFNQMNVKGAYITSYGLGVDALFGNDKNIEPIKEFLKANNIDFKTEYSEAMWVYRFIISKKEENLQRLANVA